MPGSKDMFTVTANGFSFSFSKDEIETLDIVQKSKEEFNLLKNNRSVSVSVMDVSQAGKKCKVEVEGEKFDIEIKEPLDLKLEEMGFGIVANKQVKEIKAPMPGLVLEIAVAEGQSVLAGDVVLILVAMKMENSIKMTVDATIKRIAVKPGQAVEKGQILVELD